MRRQVHPEPAVHAAVPAFCQGLRLAQGLLADLVPVLPNLFVDAGEVDVVDAATGVGAKPDLAHRRQGLVGVDVAVVDQGRAEQKRLQGAEPRQRHRLLGRDVVPVRYARRVGRGEAHVLGDAAHHGQDGVGVDVDEARRDDAARAVDASRRLGHRLQVRTRGDHGQPVAGDADHRVLD